MRGLLSSRRKDEQIAEPLEQRGNEFGQVPSQLPGTDREAVARQGGVTHTESNTDQSQQSRPVTLEQQQTAVKKRIAVVGEPSPPAAVESASFLRPLKLVGTKTTPRERKQEAQPLPANAPPVTRSYALSNNSSLQMGDSDKSVRPQEAPAPAETEMDETILQPGPAIDKENLLVGHALPQVQSDNRPSSEIELEGRLAEARHHARNQHISRATGRGNFQATAAQAVFDGSQLVNPDSHFKETDYGRDSFPQNEAEPNARLGGASSADSMNLTDHHKADDWDESDDDARSSISLGEAETPRPTTFLGKTYEGLPFGPDVPAVSHRTR